MTLQTLITEKLATQNLHELAKKLGYPNDQKLSLRLDTILASSNFALDKRKHKPQLFIETNFKRTSESVHVLSAMQHSRYLAIDSAVQSLSLNSQLDQIRLIVKAHYEKQTKLPLWGDIQQYVYFYEKDVIIIISPQGEILDTVDDYGVSRATLRL